MKTTKTNSNSTKANNARNGNIQTIKNYIECENSVRKGYFLKLTYVCDKDIRNLIKIINHVFNLSKFLFTFFIPNYIK